MSQRNADKRACFVCRLQVLNLPWLPAALCNVSPFQLAHKRDPRWYHYVSSTDSHAFTFLVQRLSVVPFSLVPRMDGDQAP
jgi:hypothetical protein